VRTEKRVYLFRLIDISLFAFVGVWLLYSLLNITFANENQATPNVIVTINTNGSISNHGSLFGDHLWYPGKEESGIIRIQNNYKKIRVTGMGLNISLNGYQQEYGEEMVMASFLKNMKLIVKKGKFLYFNKVILDNIKFLDLVNNGINDIFNGLVLEESDSFNIGKSDSIDLKYTIRMDEDAGAEMQSLSANIQFIIDFGE